MCAKRKPILNEHIIFITGQSEPVSILIRNLGPSARDAYPALKSLGQGAHTTSDFAFCEAGEAQAQRWEENLVEAAEKNHGFAGVESLKGGYRMSFEAVLAVVIVFEDEGLGFVRPRKEGQAPLERHRGAEGKLMRGGHVSRPSAVPETGPGSNIETMFVYRHWDDVGPPVSECSGRAEVAGVLEPDCLTGL